MEAMQADDARVARLVDQLLALEHARDWRNALQSEVDKPEYALEALATARPLRRVLDKLGLVAAIKRAVADFHGENERLAQAAARRQAREEQAALVPERALGAGLDVVAAARASWEKITRDELLRFASEQRTPLVAPARRPAATADEEKEDDPEPALSCKPPPSTRFLYDGRDLLHLLQSIKPANRTAHAAPPWGSIQLQLHAPSPAELRRAFAELAPASGQIGLDELFPVERQAFLADKHRVGDLVCAHGRSVAMARQYAKTGCPVSLRAAVWRQALALAALSSDQRQYFAGLQAHVAQWTYVTDAMYRLDLQRVIDSCDYFVFQDLLASVVLAFTRDGDVLERAPQVSGAVELPASHENPRPVTPCVPPCVPPNGVLPFSGLVLYAAPLAYLFGDAAELYFVFREMYVRYWSRLNTVRGERSTILPLCKLFEELVLRSSPAACLHLLSVGIAPLDVAFPWIQAAFSGVLELQQLLLLWDRVLGFDSLELLAVVAAALFHFRARELERVADADDLRLLFAELLEIQVVPLLQEYLFLLT